MRHFLTVSTYVGYPYEIALSHSQTFEMSLPSWNVCQTEYGTYLTGSVLCRLKTYSLYQLAVL